MKPDDRRCFTPGCGHGWPAHSGPMPECTVSGCDCRMWTEGFGEGEAETLLGRLDPP